MMNVIVFSFECVCLNLVRLGVTPIWDLGNFDLGNKGWGWMELGNGSEFSTWVEWKRHRYTYYFEFLFYLFMLRKC